LLKLVDCVATGGEVKHFLQSRRVTVNGQPETRRGRKLVAGDVVEAEGCGAFAVERS
jgi:ribosome-associated protein YbcJ (S4-like RNA binding protein)